MGNVLDGKTIAMLATDGVEQSELTQPWQAVVAAGATVHLVSLQPGTIRAKIRDSNLGDDFPVDRVVEEVDPSGYDGLILPGGVSNPDKLRIDAAAVAFVRGFFEQHKPVGAICHGPWLLVEADVASGRTLTSYPSLRTDLENAGAHWMDGAVVTDGNLVTSRNPGDLDGFCEKLVEEFAEAHP